MLALSLIVATHSAAQDISPLLRAGEHNAFTRVVLTLPEQVSWRLDNQGSYIDLIIEDSSIAIDLSQTFTRIPRTRLRAVEAIDSGVRLLFACRCPVRIIEGLPGQVILDILSESTASEDDLSGAGLIPKPRPKTIPQAAEPISSPSSIAERAGIALAKVIKESENADVSSGLSVSLTVAANESGDSSSSDYDNPVSDGEPPLEQKLARILSEEATANLLLPAQEFTPSDTNVAEISDVAAGHIQLRNTNRQRLIEPENQSCEDAVSAQILGWDDPYGKAGINLRWAKLYDPVDNINAEEASAIAIGYLLGTFGAEARAILTLLPRTKAVEAMLDLSHVMDLEPEKSTGLLGDYAECSDIDTLWAQFSNPTILESLPDADKRIVRAFQQLPVSLRAHLGPSLIQNLVRQDETETAGLIQNAIDRTTAASNESRSFNDLLLTLPDRLNDLEMAQALGLSDGELAFILEEASARGFALPDPVLSVAQSRLLDYRRSPFGASLALSTAHALGRAGRFDEAFSLVNSTQFDLPQGEKRAVVNDLFEMLNDTADDTGFVITLFNEMQHAKALLPASLRLRLAERLSAMGFAAQAEDLRFAKTSDLASENLAEPTFRLPANLAGSDAPAARSDTGTKPNVALADVLRPASDAAPEPNGQPIEGQAIESDEIRSLALQNPPENASGEVRDTQGEEAEPRQSAGSELSPLVAGAAENGLLAQGRASLAQSEILRAQLQALLTPPAPP